jgi:hypothetical protein
LLVKLKIKLLLRSLQITKLESSVKPTRERERERESERRRQGKRTVEGGAVKRKGEQATKRTAKEQRRCPAGPGGHVKRRHWATH